MTKKKAEKSAEPESKAQLSGYVQLVDEISVLLEQARRTAARTVNNILTATYWEIGRRIVEYEQRGKVRAEYGEQLLNRLSADLKASYGRGFSARNLRQMRTFYLNWVICQAPSGKFEARVKLDEESVGPQAKRQTLSAKSEQSVVPVQVASAAGVSLTDVFPLSWSQYVRLMSVENARARAFYETEAVRGGWSVRQLDRQISTQFYDRAVRSKDPNALLVLGQVPQAQDVMLADEEVRDPYLLEFLNLKDEYSETDLEDALIRHLEWFLLEMGTGFTFQARQKRIRIGNSWYRIDLLLYHRRLRCLVVIDLKTGAFTHADAGQMNLYLNYAREHLTMEDEADPVGIIMCSDKDDAVVKYATGGIHTKVFASKYLTNLPDADTLRREILTTQRAIQARHKEIHTDE